MSAGARELDFYYGLGSRYSYLASTQILRLQADTGWKVRWRPLCSADLFEAGGADPFQGRPVSGQYDRAWRRFDATCWADYYGVPFREPADVRFEPRRLAVAATAAARLGALEAFSRRLFQAIFIDGTSPLDDAICGQLACEVGLDRAGFAAALAEPATAAALRATVAEALAAGVFGVPSFVLDGRVYFGNDRLPIVRHVLTRPAGAR